MHKLFPCLILVSFLFSSCVTGHKTKHFVEAKNLSSLCPKSTEQLVLTVKTFVEKEDQRAFFGGILPDGIAPIFVCISNGTDRTVGMDDKNLNLELNIDENDSDLLTATEKLTYNDAKASMPAVGVFVGGALVLGAFPALFLADLVQQKASSKATNVIINMQNKKLSSGVIYPNEAKAGFLFYEKPESLKLNTILLGRVTGEFLDLTKGNKISIDSEISDI